jgi:hypothetical protein
VEKKIPNPTNEGLGLPLTSTGRQHVCRPALCTSVGVVDVLSCISDRRIDISQNRYINKAAEGARSRHPPLQRDTS